MAERKNMYYRYMSDEECRRQHEKQQKEADERWRKYLED